MSKKRSNPSDAREIKRLEQRMGELRRERDETAAEAKRIAGVTDFYIEYLRRKIAAARIERRAAENLRSELNAEMLRADGERSARRELLKSLAHLVKEDWEGETAAELLEIIHNALSAASDPSVAKKAAKYDAARAEVKSSGRSGVSYVLQRDAAQEASEKRHTARVNLANRKDAEAERTASVAGALSDLIEALRGGAWKADVRAALNKAIEVLYA